MSPQVALLSEAKRAVGAREWLLLSVNTDVTGHVCFLPCGVGTEGAMMGLAWCSGRRSLPRSRYSPNTRDHL